MGSNSILSYWNVNVPESQWTAECPDFLLNLNPKDLAIISTPDADYQALTWDQVRAIAALKRLDLFQRVPSDLRRYKAFNHKLAQQYGSVTSFILSERLRWKAPIQAKGNPFESSEDFRILYNDWPYGIDERIVHLVVWTKFSLEDDPSTGALTEQSHRQISQFMSETFSQHVPSDQVFLYSPPSMLRLMVALDLD